MATLDERAQELIDNYALGHAGTAFSVGQLGGQFGADRIALTALTVKMINALCDLYGIHDKAARMTHITSAIARLTLKGTVIAHTILNWIPIIGPGANSVTTYFLTGRAGMECIDDIKNNRMTLIKQIGLAIGRSALTFGAAEISHSIGQAADFVTDDILIDVKMHSELIATFLDHHSAMEESAKHFLSYTIRSTGTAIIRGKKPDVRTILENTFYATMISELCGYNAKRSEYYLKDKDALISFVNSSGLREKLPGMSGYFDRLAIKYQSSVSDNDISTLVSDVENKIYQSLSYVRSSDKSNLENIIRLANAWDRKQHLAHS